MTDWLKTDVQKRAHNNIIITVSNTNTAHLSYLSQKGTAKDKKTKHQPYSTTMKNSDIFAWLLFSLTINLPKMTSEKSLVSSDRQSETQRY